MTQPLGTQPVFQRTQLSADETARAEANFLPYVAEALAAKGRFRVTADSPEMVELFQKVARSAGDLLQRPVVSYANGREIVITFGHEAPGLTDLGGLSVAPPPQLRTEDPTSLWVGESRSPPRRHRMDGHARR